MNWQQTMKRTILAAAFIAILGSAGVSWAADYDKGVAAYWSEDYASALREWRPLAEQGNALAQFNLGLMYFYGQGVPKDFVSAHMWVNIAAANGHTVTETYRDDFAKKMTPADISEAQKLARECERKKYKGC
jgi:TPR repeat protein